MYHSNEDAALARAMAAYNRLRVQELRHTRVSWPITPPGRWVVMEAADDAAFIVGAFETMSGIHDDAPFIRYRVKNSRARRLP
jgi:hypothetical protein